MQPTNCDLFYLDTPIGILRLALDANHALHAASWAEDGADFVVKRELPPPVLALRSYFEGDLAALELIKVASPGTPFQHAVWNALRQIPAGMTVSYQAIARQIGQPTAVRAVGAANGANPIAIVVPCHRVIGKNGKLIGYAGGLHRKEWLLAHERVHLQSDPTVADGEKRYASRKYPEQTSLYQDAGACPA